MDAAAPEATPAQHPKYAEYVTRQEAAGKPVTPYEQWLVKYERMANAKAAQGQKSKVTPRQVAERGATEYALDIDRAVMFGKPSEEAPKTAVEPEGLPEFSERLVRLERLMVGFIESQTQTAPTADGEASESIPPPPPGEVTIATINGEDGQWLFNSYSRNHVLVYESQDRMLVNGAIVPPRHRTIEFSEWEYRTEDPAVAEFIKQSDEFKAGRITLGVSVVRKPVPITTGPKTTGSTPVQRVERPAGALSAKL